MKCLVIVAIAVLANVQANPKPYGFGGMGMGGYDSGIANGHTAYEGGNNGYLNNGYGQQMLQAGHNIGHQENDYDASVHSHQSEGHDIGGMSAYGGGGHSNRGWNNYAGGQNDYGRGWMNGFMF